MIYGSVSSGIEAATAAWHPLGWVPAFFSQFDPDHDYKRGPDFPSAVLAHHYGSNTPGEAWSGNAPPNYGDMNGFEEWPDATIDLLVGGTPCQDFSIAGLRAGMDGVRGSLTLTYAAIARRFRPKWLVWENVPGVLSSNGGRDFASLLGLLAGRRIEIPAGGWQVAGIVPGYAGAYGLAWRVLDAQFVRVDGFGRAVPQRRRRVFIVGYLGDWRRAAAVLFERESLRGNPPPRRKEREIVAPTISARTKGGAGLGTDFDCDGGLIAYGVNNTRGAIDVSTALRAHGGPSGHIDFESETFVVSAAAPVSATLPAGGNLSGGNRQPGMDAETAATYLLPLVAPEIAQTLPRGAESSGKGGYAGRRQEDDSNLVAHAIQAGALRENPNSGPDGVGVQADIAYTLEARAEVQAVQHAFAVRRLMPLECERLQGFPDGYTDILFRGKPAADGPRYKALGNSMAVNVMRWLGRRIEMVDAI